MFVFYLKNLQPILSRCIIPHIVYLSGSSLGRLPGWPETVTSVTQHEPHLLPQQTEAIRAAGFDNRLVVAVDTEANNTFVGSIALWPLGVATNGVEWQELGTVFVTEAYRFRQSHLGVADELHRQIIVIANGHDILATTTNDKERKVWQRIGLILVPFSGLPDGVLPATCVCPFHKIGVANPLDCPYRDRACTAAIAPETRDRISLI